MAALTPIPYSDAKIRSILERVKTIAMNGRYLINEKGALDEAAAFPLTIDGLRDRVASVWEAIGRAEYVEAFLGLRAMERESKGLLAEA